MPRTKTKALAAPTKLMIFHEGEAYRVRLTGDGVTLTAVEETPITVIRTPDGPRCSCRYASPCVHLEALEAVGLL